MNDHIGRYVLFLLLSSPGMWIASTGRRLCVPTFLCADNYLPLALLPSSFSMYFTMLALSYSMKPASRSGYMRTLSAVTCFAISAIVGWPFALLLAAPFVSEELFVWGGDRVPANAHLTWRLGRWKRLLLCGLIASFILVSCLPHPRHVKYHVLTFYRFPLSSSIPWLTASSSLFLGISSNTTYLAKQDEALSSMEPNHGTTI